MICFKKLSLFTSLLIPLALLFLLHASAEFSHASHSISARMNEVPPHEEKCEAGSNSSCETPPKEKERCEFYKINPYWPKRNEWASVIYRIKLGFKSTEEDCEKISANLHVELKKLGHKPTYYRSRLDTETGVCEIAATSYTLSWVSLALCALGDKSMEEKCVRFPFSTARTHARSYRLILTRHIGGQISATSQGSFL